MCLIGVSVCVSCVRGSDIQYVDYGALFPVSRAFMHDIAVHGSPQSWRGRPPRRLGEPSQPDYSQSGVATITSDYYERSCFREYTRGAAREYVSGQEALPSEKREKRRSTTAQVASAADSFAVKRPIHQEQDG